MQQELLATIAPAPSPGDSDGSAPVAIRLAADLTADTSAGDRTRDRARSGWRRVRESRWLKIAAAAVLLGVLAVPIAWSYRDRLGHSMTGGGAAMADGVE